MSAEVSSSSDPEKGVAVGDTRQQSASEIWDDYYTSQTASSEDCEQLWKMYNDRADEVDKAEAETLKGTLDGLVILSGLFSATVTAFIIESYKDLKQDPADTTNVYLSQIAQLLATSQNLPLNSTIPIPIVTSDNFSASSTAVHVNTLWFLSLIFSLSCALGAILLQSWSNRYMRLVNQQPNTIPKARRRAFLRDGMQYSNLSAFIAGIPALMHISLALFFIGLVEFISPINQTVGNISRDVLIVLAIIYLLFTFSYWIFPNVPFQTPLGVFLWSTIVDVLYLGESTISWLVLQITTLLVSFRPSYDTHFAHSWKQFRDNFEKRALAMYFRPSTPKQSPFRETRAIRWLADNSTDDQVEDLVVQLSKSLDNNPISTVNARGVSRVAVTELSFFPVSPVSPPFPVRMGALLSSTMSLSPTLSSRSKDIVIGCISILWTVFSGSKPHDAYHWNIFHDIIHGPWWKPWCSPDTLKSLLTLAEYDRNPYLALHARCTTALIFTRALSDLKRWIERGVVRERLDPDRTFDSAVHHLRYKEDVEYRYEIYALDTLLELVKPHDQLDSFYCGTPQALFAEGSLRNLNRLLDRLVTYDGFSGKTIPKKLAVDTINNVIEEWLKSPTSPAGPATQLAFVITFRRFLDSPSLRGPIQTTSDGSLSLIEGPSPLGTLRSVLRRLDIPEAVALESELKRRSASSSNSA